MMLEIVIRWGIPALCVGTTTWAAAQIKIGKERNSAIQLGVLALLRDRLYQTHFHYMEKGFYPIYARENVDSMYKQYKALGGNGTITNLIQELNTLPTGRKEIRG